MLDDNSFFASRHSHYLNKSFKNKNSELTVITSEQIRIVNDSQETPGRKGWYDWSIYLDVGPSVSDNYFSIFPYRWNYYSKLRVALI
jgi:hypothetical protein